MNPRSKSSERGQAMILVMLALIGLLGFTALAIDGGMVYADRRYAQNASDAASLAGGAVVALSLENSFMTYAQWNCNDSRVVAAEVDAKAAAVSRAGDNDFSIDQDISDNHGVITECGQEDNVFWIDKFIDITTMISSTTQTAFVHFVYSGPLINNVEAVTRVRPRIPLAYGNAIVALNTAGCSGNNNGVVFAGSSVMSVNGGGVFSNGCLTGVGSQFVVNVTNGVVAYAGDPSGNLSNITPAPVPVANPLPPSTYAVPLPDCSGLPNWGSHTGAGTISPGSYSSIKLTSGDLDLLPGLYCITGGPKALDVTGGVLTGGGVTIYATNGGIDISGNADVNLSAPPRSPDPYPAISGMVIILGPGNTSDIKLVGNDDSAYLGTIYAPDGDVEISGSSGTHATFSTQIIANNVNDGGNATIEINFDGDDFYNQPAAIELYK